MTSLRSLRIACYTYRTMQLFGKHIVTQISFLMSYQLNLDKPGYAVCLCGGDFKYF